MRMPISFPTNKEFLTIPIYSVFIIMDYILSEEQLDKVMKHYFDYKFENAVLKKEKIAIDNSDIPWYGFWVDDNVVLGYPVESTNVSYTWFSDGPYFQSGWDLFGLTTPEFLNTMVRYLNKKYPKLIFDKVF